MNKKEQMLRDIGIVDFTLVELMLFLDTHANDRKAMEYFKHYSKVKLQMEMEFSKTFFPLKKEFADCDREWEWAIAPLPWEGECG